MDTHTRRRALRVAAKLAVGVTFVGCGGKLATLDDDSGVIITHDASKRTADAANIRDAITDVGIDVSMDAGKLQCVDEITSLVDAGISSEELTCCLDLVRKVTPDAASIPDVIKADASLANCCSAILAAGNDDPSLGSVVGATAFDCCDALQWPQSNFCAAWGPPVPPALFWEMKNVA